MPNLSDEIEACPFCGGHASLRSQPHDGIDTEFWYLCTSCAATGPWCKNAHGALRLWNTRAIFARHEQEDGLLIEIADCAYCDLCQDHFRTLVAKVRLLIPAFTLSTPADPPDLADEKLPLIPTSQYEVDAELRFQKPAEPPRAKVKRANHTYDCSAGIGMPCDCGFEEPDMPGAGK
jgi:Lar family restriction alleviation protein